MFQQSIRTYVGSRMTLGVLLGVLLTWLLPVEPGAKTLFLCDDGTTLLLTDDASLGCPVHEPRADLITVPDGATWSDVEWAVAVRRAENRLASEVTSPSSESDAGNTVVLELSGTGVTSTGPFTVDDEWGIEWRAKKQFRLLVYTVTTKNASYQDSIHSVAPQLLANSLEGGSGTRYFPKGGTYRFAVSALGPWSLRVVNFSPRQ